MYTHRLHVEAGGLMSYGAQPLRPHDVLGDILAGNADCEHLGYERGRHSVQRQPERVLGGRRIDSNDFHFGRDLSFQVSAQVPMIEKAELTTRK
jgi:hypothetical protein